MDTLQIISLVAEHLSKDKFKEALSTRSDYKYRHRTHLHNVSAIHNLCYAYYRILEIKARSELGLRISTYQKLCISYMYQYMISLG